MSFRGTCLGAFTAIGLMGCLINDPSPCTIEDDVSPDPRCVVNEPEYQFKVDYVTADGSMPAGRYNFVSTMGLNASQSEIEARNALQLVFNTDQSYVDLEIMELVFFRGNICGPGFRVKDRTGEIRVKRTRRTAVNTFDYTLELTCTNY